MKKYLLLIPFVILSASYTSQGQAVAEWQLPQTEIPLVEDGKTVATLKVRFISKSATISYEDTEYVLTLKRDQNVCIVTNRHNKQVVVTIKKLGTTLIEVMPTEGNQFLIMRTGKMKEPKYLLAGAPFLTVEDDKISVHKQQPDKLEFLAQAALVFRLVYKQYVAEKNSGNNYYPIINSASES